ncbi:MAG: hypothetical protein LBM70_10190 [Victivallales bacterium]|jgi:hypothetical protein|nr:hypothetical protein [Victivallales bacterium]
MDLKSLFSDEFWFEVGKDDFMRGYATAVVVIVGLLILLVVIRFVAWMLFRSRRCGSIVVPNAGGELTISRDAIEKAARSVLDEIGELNVRRIQLYRQGKSYSLLLYCTFIGGGKGLPEISGELRPRLLETLRNLFGISSLRKVRFRVDTLTGEGAVSAPAAPEKAKSEPSEAADVNSGI